MSNPNSCVGVCGKQAPGGCWCDSQCTGNGDCCTDYTSVCGGGGDPVCGNGTCESGETSTSCPKDCIDSAKSCKGICGKKAAGGCYCDSQCTGNGDCCADYKAECGGGGGPVCGDGKCDFGESCPQDCSTSSACPNGKCEAGETDQSCPQDCAKCFGNFSIGSTYYKSNDTTQVGAACNPKGAPKNCPDGYWVTFEDNGDCVCVVSCAAFSTPIPVGGKCNTSGSWVCKHVVNHKGTSSGKFCVATKWGLCEKK